MTPGRGVMGCGPDSATPNGVDMGPNWFGVKQLNAEVVVVAPIGSTPAVMGETNSDRAGAEAAKGF